MQGNGGIQYVPQIAVQYVYLDFDGELTGYNGEILTVENVEVIDSKLSAERIAAIVAELNTRYASQNVIFVAERPSVAEYSTIYIGKTSAFEEYGSFAGLAETIDSGNQNHRLSRWYAPRLQGDSTGSLIRALNWFATRNYFSGYR